MVTRMCDSPPSEQWRQHAAEYTHLISDTEKDSSFLREAGLVTNILELLGRCEQSTVLDIGTGSGWLFERIQPREAFACDIIEPSSLREGVRFRRDDVTSLGFSDSMFDAIVASLVLIYCADLQRACDEMYRVAKKRGARLVVSLMHPYFYRTGEVNDQGDFVLGSDLSKPACFPLNIAGEVGPFRYFYRPYPMYINALISAGWKVVEIRDWFIDIERYSNARVTGNVNRSGKVPLFTFVSCNT